MQKKIYVFINILGNIESIIGNMDFIVEFKLVVMTVFEKTYFQSNIFFLITLTSIICMHKVHKGMFVKIQGLFKDFLKTFLLFSRSENLYKILIYTLKYYFDKVGLLYLKY